MSKTAEKVIPLLNKLIEDLDSYSLNDRDAWLKMANDVRALVDDIPKQMKPLIALLNLCGKGVKAISEKSLTDYLAAIDAVADGFTAAEHYLDNGADRQTLAQKAMDRISALLPDTDAAAAPDADAANELPTPPVSVDSIDDVAALLIQADAGNRDELALIASALDRLSAEPAYSGDACGYLVEAGQAAKASLDTQAEPGEDLLEKIGQLIEQSMQAVHEMQKQPAEVKPAADAAETLHSEGYENEADDDANAIPAAATPDEEAPVDASTTHEAPEAADDRDYMPDDPDFELIGEFIEEGNDLIFKAEEALLKLETDPEDMDAVGMVFRAFHTIKGTSAFLELAVIADMGHHAESLLSRVRDREIRYSGGYADLSLRALDMLKELISRVQDALGGAPLMKPGGYNELMKILSDPEAAGISEAQEDSPPPRIGDLLVAQGKVTREDVEQVIESP
ncbi:MAG: Hpt domain-containing protein, partial [Desulfobacterales bacterium]|nr:Hpt domain-containing protein [Desulfobacterales bacterium]